MTTYRVLRTIGHGPSGPVEEVLPDRLGAEPLARRRLAVPAGPARRRLRERAEALACAGHPGIATVVDVVDVDEHHVDVVRTLGTATLAERMAAGAFSGRAVERIADACTGALRAMHAAGVAHGRIHAGNVLLVGDHVLLADPDLAAEPGTHTPADDIDDLARLLAELRSLAPAVQPPAPEPTLPHWTEWRPAPEHAASPTLALPERALAGALAFGLGTAMGVTFVLAEAVVGRA